MSPTCECGASAHFPIGVLMNSYDLSLPRLPVVSVLSGAIKSIGAHREYVRMNIFARACFHKCQPVIIKFKCSFVLVYGWEYQAQTQKVCGEPGDEVGDFELRF